MTIEVKIPAVMRTNTAGQSSISCTGNTVKEALADLVNQHSDIEKVLFDSSANLHKYVNIYIDSEDIRYIGGLEAELGDAKELTILPAVAGGQE
ncbi:MAG: MoaD/ThiS family protein [Acidimicrobiia bacterium]